MLERDSIVSMHASESKAHHCNGSFNLTFLGEGERRSPQKQERERRKNGAVLCCVDGDDVALDVTLCSARYLNAASSIHSVVP
jgi:hypothetical protein